MAKSRLHELGEHGVSVWIDYLSRDMIHGGKLALRLLTAIALIFFLERAFTPFVLRVLDPMALALHELAAFIALAVALASARAIRGSRTRHDADVASLEAA